MTHFLKFNVTGPLSSHSRLWHARLPGQSKVLPPRPDGPPCPLGPEGEPPTLRDACFYKNVHGTLHVPDALCLLFMVSNQRDGDGVRQPAGSGQGH